VRDATRPVEPPKSEERLKGLPGLLDPFEPHEFEAGRIDGFCQCLERPSADVHVAKTR
jgi:hypothetical protein